MTQQVFSIPNFCTSPALWCLSAPCCAHLLPVSHAPSPYREGSDTRGGSLLLTQAPSPLKTASVPPAVCIHQDFPSPLLLFVYPPSLSPCMYEPSAWLLLHKRDRFHFSQSHCTLFPFQFSLEWSFLLLSLFIPSNHAQMYAAKYLLTRNIL